MCHHYLRQRPHGQTWLFGAGLLFSSLFLAACNIAQLEVISATVTAEYAALVARQTRDAEALYTTITAAAQDLQVSQAAQNAAATNTAGAMLTRNAQESGSLSAQATQLARDNEATATAYAVQSTANANAFQATQNAMATAQAEEKKCHDVTLYIFEISEAPALAPAPVPTYVLGDPPELQIQATWFITNTGQCPMQNIQLLFEEREQFYPALNHIPDNAAIRDLKPGESAKLTIPFGTSFRSDPDVFGRSISWQWLIQVDNPGNSAAPSALAFRQHPRLILTLNNGWVNAVTPTPRPAPTNTTSPGG